MTRLPLPFYLLVAVALAACTPTPETYPVSGEECEPGDPVQDLEVADCLVDA